MRKYSRSNSLANSTKTTQEIDSLKTNNLIDSRVRDYINVKLSGITINSKFQKKIPKGEFTSIKTKKTGEDFCFKNAKILDEGEFSSLMKITEIPTGEKKLALIFKKKLLKQEHLKLKNIKKQILLYEQLKKDKIGKNFILNIEAVFEDRKKLYLIFENCDIVMDFSDTEKFKYEFKDKQEVNNAVSSIYHGLRTINSFKHSIISKTGLKLAKTKKNGSFVIFNFPFLAEHNNKLHLKIENELKMNDHIFEYCLRRNGYPGCTTDSFTFGEILLKLLKINFKFFKALLIKETNYEEYSQFLDSELVDLISGLLNSSRQNVTLNHIIFHSFFQKNFSKNSVKKRYLRTTSIINWSQENEINYFIYKKFYSKLTLEVIEFAKIMLEQSVCKSTVKNSPALKAMPMSEKLRARKKFGTNIWKGGRKDLISSPKSSVRRCRPLSQRRSQFLHNSRKGRVQSLIAEKRKGRIERKEQKGFFGKFIDKIMCAGR